jgi:hypothetical protein
MSKKRCVQRIRGLFADRNMQPTWKRREKMLTNQNRQVLRLTAGGVKINAEFKGYLSENFQTEVQRVC